MYSHVGIKLVHLILVIDSKKKRKRKTMFYFVFSFFRVSYRCVNIMFWHRGLAKL